MAMEKLILRSVMYGVDKIPDSWFDKVPGGFYKASQKGNDKASQGHKIDDGEGSGQRPRRYSHNGDDRRRTRRDRYEEEYREQEKRRRDRRERSSYDGGHDDHPDSNRPREERENGRRRRRHSADNDRYGYDDGYSRQTTHATDSDRRHSGKKQSRPADAYFDERQRPVTGESSRGGMPSSSKATATLGSGFAGAAAAETGAPYTQHGRAATFPAKMPSPPLKPAYPAAFDGPGSGSSTSSYVPFAHIYGAPSASTYPVSGVTPGNVAHPVPATMAAQPMPTPTASPQSYQQNPFAQQATMPVGAGGNPQIFAPQPTVPMSGARAYAGYENQPPYPETPRPSRAQERYSPTYANGNSRDSNVRRAHSERRPDKEDGQRGRAPYVNPQAPLRGQVNLPPPPPGPPPASSKDPRRDSGHADYRQSHDRGYNSD